MCLDAIHFRVREDYKVKQIAIFNVLDIKREGRKEILGMFRSEAEGANF